MRKWKYKSENLSGNFHDIVDALNSLDEEGWELVAANPVSPSICVVILRRPYGEEKGTT